MMNNPLTSNSVPSVQAIARAVTQEARAALAGWSALSPAARARRLAPLKDRLLGRAGEIAACIHEEVGKPLVEALLGEVLPSADVVEYWTRAIGDLLSPEEVDLDPIAFPNKAGTTFREARGVVGVIMPWNFPLALPLRTIVPALLAGNTVVFKPSEVTPRSGSLITTLLSGLLPEGVFGLVAGAGDAGAALCRSDVDLVVFTGSVSTGRKVALACAEQLIPCSLELGGKDAAIILSDAEIERAANGVVWGAMMNAGQNCASIERVYVERSVAEAFSAAVCKAVASLRPGVDVGPLATSAQLETVARHVRDAVAHGSEILVGGTTDGGTHFAPTVIEVKALAAVDAEHADALMCDETFGPVVPIAIVETAGEAIARANASRYGLTASIWSRDTQAAARLAKQLRAGVVTINNHGFTGAIPAAPWSGQGETGWGITNSPLALDALTRPRFVLVDRSRKRRELWWFPYTPALTALAMSMATLRCRARSLMERGRALRDLMIAMWRRSREI